MPKRTTEQELANLLSDTIHIQFSLTQLILEINGIIRQLISLRPTLDSMTDLDPPTPPDRLES